MPFSVNRLVHDAWEVIMEPGTLRGSRSTLPRRFAYCLHENDAQVIADSLNMSEKLCQLHAPISSSQVAEVSIIATPTVPEGQIWICGRSEPQKVYFEKGEEKP